MCCKELPQGYSFYDKIDLKKNKRQFWLVQGVGIGLFLLFIPLGILIAAVADLPEAEFNGLNIFFPIIAWCAVYVIYIVLHEVTHGIFMYAFCPTKLNFGVSLTYAYCGSRAYFDKKHYILIALAPVLIWGIVLGVLNIFIHVGVWFWTVWLLQAGNVSGSAGDFYCVIKMLRYPKDILVQDTGTDMTVYTPQKEQEREREESR